LLRQVVKDPSQFELFSTFLVLCTMYEDM
jgi:hypothetical protein